MDDYAPLEPAAKLYSTYAELSCKIMHAYILIAILMNEGLGLFNKWISKFIHQIDGGGFHLAAKLPNIVQYMILPIQILILGISRLLL
ncbi:hypothetical protein AB4Z29_05305 [Paenibacillus sp. 2TAB23]|uniref:hypothetical protein n=1 Tax=Paenibacillus sp. 2TAB23 TaxID=3233004 RepID=UPI003F9DB09D